MQNAFNRLKSRFNGAEKNINEPENGSIKITQTETQAMKKQ